MVAFSFVFTNNVKRNFLQKRLCSDNMFFNGRKLRKIDLNSNNYDIRLAVYGETLPEFAELAIKNGAGLEVQDFSTPVILDGDYDKRISEIMPWIKKVSGRISIHGPFMDLSASSPDSLITGVTRFRFRQALDICSKIGADILILHSCFNPAIKHPDYTDHWVERQVDFWKEFSEEAQTRGVVIAYENLFEKEPSKSVELFSAVGSENFKACLDTGHVNLMSDFNIEKWASELDNHIHYVHFHSNSGKIDDHTSPLKGDIDFAAFFDFLSLKNPRPVITVEVREFEDAENTFFYLHENLK